ncbi:hypothetical protein HID58_084404 [Brassica napus]|uniref:Uncharacterized protein n=1 Tax=Brassica napus TaxID=3708 RepID=A0ABQ7XJT2_BRANA|nr:hypothetical protein HID58_084404 [Brassica napus]
METPPAEELLKKIRELEESQEHLKREMSRLKVSAAEVKQQQQRSHSVSPQRRRNSGGEGGAAPRWRKSGTASFRHASPLRKESRGGGGGEEGRSGGGGKFTEKQYLNILQSMAQAVHVFDLNGQIIFWNAMAEKLYGFSAAEALGKDPIDILVDDQDAAVAQNITRRCGCGESWTGEFPVKNKAGDRSKMQAGDNSSAHHEGGSGDSHHSDQGFFEAALFERKEDAGASTSTARGDFIQSPFGVFLRSDDKSSSSKPFRDSSDENEIPKTLASKAEEWMAKKGLSWPWKGNEQEGLEGRRGHSVWPWVQNEPQKEEGHQSNKAASNEAVGGYWSSPVNVNSTSSASSCGSTSSSVMNKVDMDSDCLDYEILWEDLTIGEQIGQGSCGTVYHGLWFGSDVAVKVFSKQEYSEEIITSFRQEVSLMKRLRHPNVLLFMGAVTSPQRLCIVTEFLPRGSLFRLLQRNTSKLDWRRRIHMASDIARGMNYLHHCSPPIIHRDLKSSNLLVDRNWTVKVADFGLSRIKHETYLTTKTGRGTPQWMAPEVLRNEAADEKSDVYSFGVVLWELVTEKIPWENLNAMQVIGAVGFMNQRLEVPKDVDPQWISLMESCWHSEPQCRPTFQQVMEKLRELQRKYTMQFQATRAASIDNSSLKEK